MGAPFKLRILGRDFQCEYKTPDEESILRDCDGAIFHDRQQIVVDRNKSLCNQREVVLHEVFHAIARATVMGLTEPDTGRLSRALYAVLRDNPTLGAWLSAEDEEKAGGDQAV